MNPVEIKADMSGGFACPDAEGTKFLPEGCIIYDAKLLQLTVMYADDSSHTIPYGGLKLTSFRHLCMSKGRIKMSNSSGRLQAVYKTHYILTPSPGSTLNFLESRVLGRPRNIMGIQVIPDTALKPAGYDGRVVLHVSGRKPELEAASKSTYYKELRDKLASKENAQRMQDAFQPQPHALDEEVRHKVSLLAQAAAANRPFRRDDGKVLGSVPRKPHNALPLCGAEAELVALQQDCIKPVPIKPSAADVAAAAALRCFPELMTPGPLYPPPVPTPTAAAAAAAAASPEPPASPAKRAKHAYPEQQDEGAADDKGSIEPAAGSGKGGSSTSNSSDTELHAADEAAAAYEPTVAANQEAKEMNTKKKKKNKATNRNRQHAKQTTLQGSSGKQGVGAAFGVVRRKRRQAAVLVVQGGLGHEQQQQQHVVASGDVVLGGGLGADEEPVAAAGCKAGAAAAAAAAVEVKNAGSKAGKASNPAAAAVAAAPKKHWLRLWQDTN